MRIPFLSSAISGVSNLINKWIYVSEAKQKRKDDLAKLSLENKLNQISNASEADIESDSLSRKLVGLMDDISFYIFLSPTVLVFIPNMAPHVEAGFKALEKLPDWWKYSLALMLISVWGYKRIFAPIIQKIAEARINGILGLVK